MSAYNSFISSLSGVYQKYTEKPSTVEAPQITAQFLLQVSKSKLLKKIYQMKG
jgi:hypothetical protein